MKAVDFAQTLGADWKLAREGYVHQYPWPERLMGEGMERTPVPLVAG